MVPCARCALRCNVPADSEVSSLWVTCRPPKDIVRGIARGLQRAHVDKRTNDHCTAFAFSMKGGASAASSVVYKSADASVHPVTISTPHGGIRVYTQGLHCENGREATVLHEVPANQDDYTKVTLLIEGARGTVATPKTIKLLGARLSAMPLPAETPELSPSEYAGLCNISRQVQNSLLGGHYTQAERSLGGACVRGVALKTHVHKTGALRHQSCTDTAPVD